MIYPCVYREHCLSRLQASAVRGLSLCVQGTRFFQLQMIQLLAVYPCVYREHSYKFFILFPNGGLSLCVQGTLEHTCIILVSTRFIPVHTGNIFQPLPIFPFLLGLSLCIQGTLFRFTVLTAERRFIPVCTGNTITTQKS